MSTAEKYRQSAGVTALSADPDFVHAAAHSGYCLAIYHGAFWREPSTEHFAAGWRAALRYSADKSSNPSIDFSKIKENDEVLVRARVTAVDPGSYRPVRIRLERFAPNGWTTGDFVAGHIPAPKPIPCVVGEAARERNTTKPPAGIVKLIHDDSAVLVDAITGKLVIWRADCLELAS